MRCRAGSAVRPPTRTPETVTPREIRCAGVDAGAAAHASPAQQSKAASVLSTGREFNHVQGFSASAPSDPVRTVMNPMATGTWQLEQCSHADVRALAEALAVSETTASVLARRGHRDVEEARRFLEGSCPATIRSQLGDMEAAVATIRAAVARGARICVHGDYDADGICATALAVLLLRELGADVAWHLPSRFEEGYGLNAGTLTRLAEEGFDLVLTVDCGITAVAEVEHARSLGLEVVITDHHRPAEEFPACPVVAPLKGDYPFAGLCGTGVVWKLAQALLGEDHAFCDRHLDVVALATVADVVPLVDENRALALLGLRRLAQTQKLGLRALDARRGRRRGSGRRIVDRLPARAADQRLGTPVSSGGGARAAPDRGRARGEGARRGARRR